MKNKFLNVKVGVEFYDALTSHPVFKEHWKAISPCFYFLKLVSRFNAKQDGNFSEIYSGKIDSIFKSYDVGGYGKFLNALVTLKMLEIDQSFDYQGNKNGNLNPGERGECKKYKITDHGCELLHSSNLDYLKKLHFDPKVRRRNQKNISARKVMSLTYGDPVLDYVHDGLKHICFDPKDAEHVFLVSHWSKLQKENVSSILCSFSEKKFDKLEVNNADGRVHHEVVRLKSDARSLLSYKGVPYQATLDIRCCHATYLSYVLTHPTPLHLLPGKTDNRDAIASEHVKWIALFCNPDNDPKQIIQIECGYEDAESAKTAINQSLNGSKEHPKFLAWVKAKFPLLYNMWQKTDVKQTGVNISKQCESKLILSEALFDYATEIGVVKIMPEHDGVGVFGENSDPHFKTRLKKLADFIRDTSVEMFGIPVVIKTKFA